MTTSIRITSGIFVILSGLLFHFNYPTVALVFAILGLGGLVMSLFFHKKEEEIKLETEKINNKEHLLNEARKSYKGKKAVNLLAKIDSFNVSEREKHEIYNTVVSEQKSHGGKVKSNPYKNK